MDHPGQGFENDLKHFRDDASESDPSVVFLEEGVPTFLLVHWMMISCLKHFGIFSVDLAKPVPENWTAEFKVLRG